MTVKKPNAEKQERDKSVWKDLVPRNPIIEDRLEMIVVMCVVWNSHNDSSQLRKSTFYHILELGIITELSNYIRIKGPFKSIVSQEYA